MMLKVGVIGAGHLGRIHIGLWQQIERVKLVGFYDPFDENAEKAIAMGVKRFNTLDELLAEVNTVDIVSTTTTHYENAVQCLKKNKHIFVEKPLTNTLREAQHLLTLIEEAGVKGQVGHVERFNPAFLAIKKTPLQPMFIECHRLAQFNPRGADVAVILDLMIHDIDIILSIVKANVKKISASGVAIVSDTPDIANARLEFDNGCVANITASRISLKKMRKMRIFQKDAYIGIDFLEKKTEVCSLSTEANGNEWAIPIDLGNNQQKFIHFDMPEVVDNNAIKTELELFRNAIENDTETEVPFLDGFKAMQIGYEIIKKIEKNNLQ
jgi:predicted dehydrogenase